MALWTQWTPLDLRSMRSLQSQSKSQQRLLNSQASLRQRVLASNQASQVVSGEAKAPPENEVDVLSRLREEELCALVRSPPALEAGDDQSKLNLLAMDRTPLASEHCDPRWVQVHIYNLSETFVGANQVLTWSEGPAIGGAFHVGVEVYGAEWSYGVYGVACDPPRSETAHVYECSVFVGATAKNQEEVAQVLFRLCQEWPGRNYDVLSHNCCSFGRKFVENLGVGPMPLWIDRFARTLHDGREAYRRGVQEMKVNAHHAGTVIKRTVMEDVPVMVEVARPHVERAVTNASVFVAARGKEAGDVIHKVVMHDVPVMVETARPYVEQAGEAVHKAVAEDAPKAVAAAQPYVEHAMNTAMLHTSNAMSSAGEVLSEHAQLAATHLAAAAEALHEQLFGENDTSSDEEAEFETPMEMAPRDTRSEDLKVVAEMPASSMSVEVAPFQVPSRPMQSPTAQVAAGLPPTRFISAASHEDVRLMVPSRIPSADLAAVRQNQVQWPARMHSLPRPPQASWMPPLPSPNSPYQPLPRPAGYAAYHVRPQGW